MKLANTIWKSIGSGKANPTDVFNLLVELDNRKGQLGLWALEKEIYSKREEVRTEVQPLLDSWVSAITVYRESYYPSSAVSRLFGRPAKNSLPMAG